MSPLSSKQRPKLLGKSANVLENDFTMDVLLHKKLRKAKIKTSQGNKSFYNADSDAEMPMPRFLNGQEKLLMK